jgi:hypothetical protein
MHERAFRCCRSPLLRDNANPSPLCQTESDQALTPEISPMGRVRQLG